MSCGGARTYSAQVSEANVASNTDASLDATADVISVPGYTLWYVGVDTASSEEGTGVLDVGVVGRDLHDEADDGNESEADHEDSTSL
jgi:hypothetical protein